MNFVDFDDEVTFLQPVLGRADHHRFDLLQPSLGQGAQLGFHVGRLHPPRALFDESIPTALERDFRLNHDDAKSVILHRTSGGDSLAHEHGLGRFYDGGLLEAHVLGCAPGEGGLHETASLAEKIAELFEVK